MPKGVYEHPPQCGFQKEHHVSPKTEFKKGHPFYGDLSKPNYVKRGQTGQKHPGWKGGKVKHSEGYILIYKPKHPFCDYRGYVLEHRLVVEQQIGQYLLHKETCHHLNDIKDDNHPQNLMAFTSKSAHIRFHKDPNSVKPEEIIFDGRL